MGPPPSRKMTRTPPVYQQVFSQATSSYSLHHLLKIFLLTCLWILQIVQEERRSYQEEAHHGRRDSVLVIIKFLSTNFFNHILSKFKSPEPVPAREQPGVSRRPRLRLLSVHAGKQGNWEICKEIGFGNQLRLNHSSESFCCTPCFFDHFRVKYETSLFTLRFRLDSKKIALIYSFCSYKVEKTIVCSSWLKDSTLQF